MANSLSLSYIAKWNLIFKTLAVWIFQLIVPKFVILHLVQYNDHFAFSSIHFIANQLKNYWLKIKFCGDHTKESTFQGWLSFLVQCCQMTFDF